MVDRWEDEPSATNDVDELREEFRKRLYGKTGIALSVKAVPCRHCNGTGKEYRWEDGRGNSK